MTSMPRTTSYTTFWNNHRKSTSVVKSHIHRTHGVKWSSSYRQKRRIVLFKDVTLRINQHSHLKINH
jgi:hypothetical protein